MKVRNRATSAPTYSLGLRAHLLSQPSSLALWCHVLSFNILGSENQFRSCSRYCINKRIYHQVQNSMVISGHMQQNQPCPFSLSTPDSISRTARYSLVPGISVCAPTRQAAFVPLLRSSSVELYGARVILWRGSDSRNHKKSYVRRACRLNNSVRAAPSLSTPLLLPRSRWAQSLSFCTWNILHFR